MNTLRILVLVIGSLVAGFALGWRVKPASHQSPATMVNTPERNTLASSQMPSSAPAPALNVPSQTRPPHPASPTTLELLGSTRALKKLGLPLAFHPVVYGSAKLDPLFAKVFGLNDSEKARIAGALKDANDQIQSAFLRSAKPTLNAEGNKLTIDYAPLSAAESGAIYERTLAVVKETLGPDRYTFFDELAGEPFDGSMERFGLNKIRYELDFSPNQADHPGNKIIKFRRSYQDANGTVSGNSSGETRQDAMLRDHPLAAPFLPEKLRPTRG